MTSSLQPRALMSACYAVGCSSAVGDASSADKAGRTDTRTRPFTVSRSHPDLFPEMLSSGEDSRMGSS